MLWHPRIFYYKYLLNDTLCNHQNILIDDQRHNQCIHLYNKKVPLIFKFIHLSGMTSLLFIDRLKKDYTGITMKPLNHCTFFQQIQFYYNTRQYVQNLHYLDILHGLDNLYQISVQPDEQ